MMMMMMNMNLMLLSQVMKVYENKHVCDVSHVSHVSHVSNVFYACGDVYATCDVCDVSILKIFYEIDLHIAPHCQSSSGTQIHHKMPSGVDVVDVVEIVEVVFAVVFVHSVEVDLNLKVSWTCFYLCAVFVA